MVLYLVIAKMELENQKKTTEEKLSAGNGTTEDFIQWGKELLDINNLIDTKTERWMELAEKADN